VRVANHSPAIAGDTATSGPMPLTAPAIFSSGVRVNTYANNASPTTSHARIRCFFT